MTSAPVDAALQAFEAAHGLRVSVHDVGGRLAGFLPPERLRHEHPVCRVVKYRGHKSACARSDGPALYPRLLAAGDVVLRRCHAGVLECIGALLVDGRLEAVLYVGALAAEPVADLARLVVDDLPPVPILCEPRCSAAQGALTRDGLAQRDARGLVLLGESLRQLLARLADWLLQHAALAPQELAAEDWIQRRARIERFVLYQHTRPVRLADLAAELGLSADRVGHVVREVCGCRWSDLLTAARLTTAETLLVETDLSMAEVARRSGFAAATHLHRMFRRHRGESPGAFRRARRA